MVSYSVINDANFEMLTMHLIFFYHLLPINYCDFCGKFPTEYVCVKAQELSVGNNGNVVPMSSMALIRKGRNSVHFNINDHQFALIIYLIILTKGQVMNVMSFLCYLLNILNFSQDLIT